MGFRPVHTDGGRRGKAACCRASRTHPPGRQSRYSRNGIRESRKAVAHDTVVAARGSLSLASVLSLMERLRFITSLIGCLQASARRRQARKARFNSQVIPSGGSSAIASLISLMLQPGHTCPDVCERRPGGGLWSLWEPLAEEGEEGATMQSRRHPGLAGRRPLHFFRKCWRVAVSAYAGAAICFFGLILRSGFRAWERRSGHLQN